MIAGGWDGTRDCRDWFNVDVERKTVERVEGFAGRDFGFDCVDN